jgi:hypothetical protein
MKIVTTMCPSVSELIKSFQFVRVYLKVLVSTELEPGYKILRRGEIHDDCLLFLRRDENTRSFRVTSATKMLRCC